MGPRNGAQNCGVTLRGDAPGRRELGLEKDAAAQMGGSQHVRQGVHRPIPRSGVSVMSSGAAIIAGSGRRSYTAASIGDGSARRRHGPEQETDHERIGQTFPTPSDMPTASRHPRRCAGTSRRTSIRGRSFDLTRKYLPDGLSLVREFTGALRRPRSASSARSRAAPTPTSSAWSSASSPPSCSRSAATTGWATRMRWRPWCASATRSSSTRRCSAASRR